jgi:hypothetical protein
MNEIFLRYKNDLFKISLNLHEIPNLCIEYILFEFRKKLLQLKLPIKLRLFFKNGERENLNFQSCQLQNDFLKLLINVDFTELEIKKLCISSDNIEIINNKHFLKIFYIKF